MAATSIQADTSIVDPSSQRALRVAAIVFLTGFALHNADHLRRGFDVVTKHVLVSGSATGILTLVSILLVLRSHPRSAEIAFAVGFGMAVGVTAVHLLPDWSALSDSLPDGTVDGWTWVAVLAEIAGATAFGCAGWYAMRRAHAT
ncbi:MAG: hypothetical protein QOE63_912 [Acidimicrobiaceae bacterium]